MDGSPDLPGYAPAVVGAAAAGPGVAAAGPGSRAVHLGVPDVPGCLDAPRRGSPTGNRGLGRLPLGSSYEFLLMADQRSAPPWIRPPPSRQNDMCLAGSDPEVARDGVG
ncbi:hypothetical protein GCM10010357_44130 [Streptomyces luteireticuli]|uniref:Uncharacterized protein n=1 Tax=Streptomyces luteireticuli TaxID=173858 RepID=A0ABP3IQZ8_9ACTN